MTQPAAGSSNAGETRRTWPRVLLGFALWCALAVPLWALFFLHSQAPVVLATHEATLSPTFNHHARLDMGPYLPDLRLRTSSPIGVRIELGKTTAQSTGELAARYAAIAARPGPQVSRVVQVVQDLAVDAALRAGLLALAPFGLWWLIGPARRAELLKPSVGRVGVVASVVVVSLVVATTPWASGGPTAARGSDTWIPLSQAVPEVAAPADLAVVEVQGGLLTETTRRLIASGFDAYDRGKVFYADLKDRAPEEAKAVRRPAEGEQMAVLVSDRHDNVEMDPVVRAFADAAGATAVIDAGDDTSTGQEWEAFSLDSLDDSFGDYSSKVAIAGNHDHGSFVSKYLAKLGWIHLDGSAPQAPFGVRLFGVDDPRSSGLGGWRDVKGPLTWDETKTKLADTVCLLDDEGQRVATVVVHDANLASQVLERGCADLVVAGHVHTQVGPDRVVGLNGKVGYTYTNGTTGGAAYAVAYGSKLRRDAEFTLITYRDGRPIGLQPVVVRTNGVYDVRPYIPLDLTPAP
jgi:hypothetical protein